MKAIVVFLAVVVGTCGASVAAPLSRPDAEAAAAAAKTFFDAVKAMQYERAYAVCSPVLKESLDDAAFAYLWENAERLCGALQDVVIGKPQRSAADDITVDVDLKYAMRTVNMSLGLVRGRGRIWVDSITLPKSVLPEPVDAPERVAQRATECVRRLLSEDIDGAYDMLDPALQQQLPLDVFRSQITRALEGKGKMRAVRLVSRRSSSAGAVQNYFFQCQMTEDSFGCAIGAAFDGKDWCFVKVTMPVDVPPPFEVVEQTDRLINMVFGDGLFDQAYREMGERYRKSVDIKTFRQHAARLITESGRLKRMIRIREGRLDRNRPDEYCFLYRLVFEKKSLLAMVGFVEEGAAAGWSLNSLVIPYTPVLPEDSVAKDAELCLRLLMTSQEARAWAMWSPPLQNAVSLAALRENLQRVVTGKGAFAGLELSELREVKPGVHRVVYTVRFADDAIKAALDYAFVGGSWEIIAFQFPY